MGRGGGTGPGRGPGGEVAMDRVHVSPASVHDVLGRYILVDGLDIVLDMEKSHGPWIHDARSGRDFIDFFSFFASLPVGLNHPKMRTQENIEALGRIALHKPTNSDVYTQVMAEYVETFGRVALPEPFKHLFFISGGGLAVENALKAAFDWKARKNLARGASADGLGVIHFKECFHGRTGYTLSLTDSPDKRKTMHFPKFPWPRINNPKISFPLEGKNLAAVEQAEARALAEVGDVIGRTPHATAALIIEPIQAEGGDNHFRGEFLRELRRICDEHEILFILDEVQTGFGLTGKFWAFEHFGFTPDLAAFGKKSQVCGIMATRRIDDVDNVFKVSSRLNSTFGGNLVDMARSRLQLEIIEDEGLVRTAAVRGTYLLERLRTMQSNLGGIIENARGRGLMCAFTLAEGVDRAEVLGRFSEAGIIILPCGVRTIRFRPTLDIPQDVLEDGMSRMEQVLKEMAAVRKV